MTSLTLVGPREVYRFENVESVLLLRKYERSIYVRVMSSGRTEDIQMISCSDSNSQRVFMEQLIAFVHSESTQQPDKSLYSTDDSVADKIFTKTITKNLDELRRVFQELQGPTIKQVQSFS